MHETELDLSRSASKRAAIVAALTQRPMTIKDVGHLYSCEDDNSIQRLRTAFARLVQAGEIAYHRDAEGKVLRDGGPLFALVAKPTRPTRSRRDVIPAPEGMRRTTGAAARGRARA